MQQAKQLRAFVTVIVVGTLFAWAAFGLAAPFAAVQLFIEFNSTDNDAGLQAFFDGKAWKEVKILDPNGLTIFEITAETGLQVIGLTEVRFESEEPSLAEILAKFPPGKYAFEGTTVDEEQLKGTATLSHDIPREATITQPSDGEKVDPNNTVIKWSHPGNGIAGFQVIVERADGSASITVDLLASATSFQIPPEFLQGNTNYKFEVLAVSTNRNRTITERIFKTMP